MSGKKLGFGLMRLPSLDPNDPGKIDIEQVKKMVDTFIERGFTYFDTAWMYCAFKSENAVKEALVSRHPRDRIFNEQMEKTGVTYFDYYLIHDINSHSIETYNKFDCFGWIRDKKEKGLVKHIGFSFHDGPELLDEVLTAHPEFEFVQLQLNYLDWESAGVQSRKCYEVAEKHGVPVFVMEPATDIINASIDIPCTGCSYCTDGCPMQIAIPKYFSLYNADMQELRGRGISQDEGWTPQSEYYENVAKHFGKASACIQCGQCEGVCPQHLPIIEYLQTVAKHFERE